MYGCINKIIVCNSTLHKRKSQRPDVWSLLLPLQSGIGHAQVLGHQCTPGQAQQKGKQRWQATRNCTKYGMPSPSIMNQPPTFTLDADIHIGRAECYECTPAQAQQRGKQRWQATHCTKSGTPSPSTSTTFTLDAVMTQPTTMASTTSPVNKHIRTQLREVLRCNRE